MTYKESYDLLTNVRQRYSSAGDVIFRSAVDTLLYIGSENISAKIHSIEKTNAWLERIGRKQMSGSIEMAVLHCAAEIKCVPARHLISWLYTKDVVFLGEEDLRYSESPIPYNRLRKIIDNLLSGIAEDYSNVSGSDHLQRLKNDGLTEAEVRYFGYEYLLDLEEGIEDDKG